MPEKEEHYNSAVLTEKNFNQDRTKINKINRYIYNKFGKSVNIKYRWSIGKEINNFQKCLIMTDKMFGNPNDTSFMIKSMDTEVGKIIIISWKNIKRLNYLYEL